MDHRALRRSIPPEAMRALTERRDAPGLARLALHLGAILAMGAGIADGVPGWPALLVAQGVMIVFLFTLLHETAHATAFRTPALNRWAGRLAGVAVAVPPVWFRHFHLAHHRHTHDPARDPELASPRAPGRLGWLWHVSGLPQWRASAGVLVGNAFGGPVGDYVPPSAVGRVRREARTMLALYAALTGVSPAAGSALLVWTWVVPALLGQPMLRLYLMAEHGRCPHVANMLENTRTTFTNRAVRWIAWNMPYHAEHHALPTVPFHRLPDLHALTRPHLRSTSEGYVAFHAEALR